VLLLLALVGLTWFYTLLTEPQQRTLDQQVYAVASQLKCPVCQHESAADSSAAIAQQMRQVIRQQLRSGRSEQQILRYFADHYGDTILLTPPRQGLSLLAWWVPVLLLLLGISLLALVVRDWRLNARFPQALAGGERGEEIADPELEHYRVQLEQELAEDQVLPG
jgi:cytochrome c-type biogenesis protein CcmH